MEGERCIRLLGVGLSVSHNALASTWQAHVSFDAPLTVDSGGGEYRDPSR